MKPLVKFDVAGWKFVPLVAALLVFSTGFEARAQQAMEIPANAIIPQPVPTAPIGNWTATPVHEKLVLERDGVTLRGWSFPGTKPGAPTLLFFNGNGMTIDRSQSLYPTIAAAGAKLVVFDYRGYGFSTGEADVAAFRGDALAIYDFVAKQAGGPVVVYGFSLGTAMATTVAAQRPVRGLILAGTIASAAEEMPVYARQNGIGADQLKGMKPDALSMEAFDLVGRIKASKAPLLMLHGQTDKLVPIAQGREVFAASPAREKKFVALPGVSHDQTPASPLGVKAVGVFLGGLK